MASAVKKQYWSTTSPAFSFFCISHHFMHSCVRAAFKVHSTADEHGWKTQHMQLHLVATFCFNIHLMSTVNCWKHLKCYRIMHPATLQKIYWNDLRNMIKVGLPIFQISIHLSIYGMCWMKNLINRGLAESIQSNPSLQLAVFKGSAANVLVPEATGHVQRSYKVLVLMLQSCSGRIRGL